MKKDKFIKIGPLPGLNYTEMVTEVLKEKGIPFSISQDGVSTAYGISGTNLAGHETFLHVPEEFKGQVKEIINRLIDHI